jgi:glycerol-3-phosphate dehydrogenase
MKRDLDRLRREEFDLLVLGGGITGAGSALDAVLRGWRVALIDKGDFAGGTSSASSKLVHGGLRYLELGQFRLVHEALQERRRLLVNAPHLVQPLRFVVPVFAGARMPRWKLRLGLTFYDGLAGRDNLRRSRPLDRRRLLREFPQLRSGGLRGGADYFDARMDDARLCLEVVKTAANHGACVANHIEATAFVQAGDAITGVRVLDPVTGHDFQVRARQVLNAAGPWVDALCRLAGDPHLPHLRPTKGVHLVLPDLGFTAAFLLFHPRDGRVFFVIPWLGKTLLGTTDTFTEDSPDHLDVTGEEIAYLLEGYGHYFTNPLSAADVLNSFAGLRPLLAARTRSPSSLSREFRIFRSPGGLLSVAGGKYTTYRHMASAIVDEVERGLGRPRPRSCRTGWFRLDGAPAGDWPSYREQMVAELQKRPGLSLTAASHLLDRYGRRAVEVAAYIQDDASLSRPIRAGEPDLHAELAYQRDHEMAIFPADHLLRRTRLGLFHPELLTSAQTETTAHRPADSR